MRVVQRLVRTEQSTPTEAKASGAMAKGKISVQHDPIHTNVAALQQITVALTQRICMTHASEVGHGLWRLTGRGIFGIIVPLVAPQGATLSERILGKSAVL